MTTPPPALTTEYNAADAARFNAQYHDIKVICDARHGVVYIEQTLDVKDDNFATPFPMCRTVIKSRGKDQEIWIAPPTPQP